MESEVNAGTQSEQDDQFAMAEEEPRLTSQETAKVETPKPAVNHGSRSPDISVSTESEHAENVINKASISNGAPDRGQASNDIQMPQTVDMGIISSTTYTDEEIDPTAKAPPPDNLDVQVRPSAPIRTVSEGKTQTLSEGISRKMSGTLSWFSRATNITKPSVSPPRPIAATSMLGTMSARRGTHPIMNGSNDKSLTPIKDGNEANSLPNHPLSLQDRFQAARLEDEGRQSIDTERYGTIGDTDEPLHSPTSHSETGTIPTSPAPSNTSRSQSRMSKNIDVRLPPGTAAGISIGPSTEDESGVDWDLWQTLVQEGPAALAKRKGDEISLAIQNGIPAPIRGVVWQVLADSKNEQLEIVYHNILHVQEPKDISLGASGDQNAVNQNGLPNEEGPLKSSASSIRSYRSAQAPSTHDTLLTPHHSDQASEEDNDKTPVAGPYNTADPSQWKASLHPNTDVAKLEKTIRKDLGTRTAFSKYMVSSGLQEGLFGVCKAYALYDEAIGYAQGMNFIAMPLLFNMSEQEAFTLFIRLMSKYDMRSMFLPEMTGLHLRLYQFERLLEDHEPALAFHLQRRGVAPISYATQWFLTLFAYKFPLQLVQRIYDLILSEGLEAILRFGIVLMQKNAIALLGMKEMSQLTTHLKEKIFDVYIDKAPSAASILDSGFFGLTGGIDKEIYHADALIRDACAIKLDPTELAQYQADFEEKSRLDKLRDSELETLKTSNAAHLANLRQLEARVQQQDADQVGLASEMIRTKVDNEALKDVNESFKIQTEELRLMVEKQPAEVEARLNEEMQRVITKNMEVQNSNRALEETVQEMEQELVTTKLSFAQVCTCLLSWINQLTIANLNS